MINIYFSLEDTAAWMLDCNVRHAVTHSVGLKVTETLGQEMRLHKLI